MKNLMLAGICALCLSTAPAYADWISVAAGSATAGNKVSVAGGYGRADTRDEAITAAVEQCAETTTDVQVTCESQGAWDEGCIYLSTGIGHDSGGNVRASWGSGSTPGMARSQVRLNLTQHGFNPEKIKAPIGGCVSE